MKEIKSIASFLYNKRILFLGFIFTCCVGFHFFCFVKAAGDGKFFLLNEDEVIYYGSAKVFSETNSAQAESCIDETVSRVGNMNWYGPGYNVVYGSVFKIAGNQESVFPWFHFILAMGILGLIFFLPIGFEARLLAGIALSVTQQFWTYIYTFFPETLVLFLATILTLLLALHYYAKDAKSKKAYLVAFIVCTLFFMLCRVTFIFWMAGLIALAENKRERFVRLGIFLISVVIGMLYMKYFTAPPYAGQMHKIDLLYKGQIFDFIRQTKNAFIDSAQAIFVEKSYGVNLLLAVIGVAILTYSFNRSKLTLAALFIGLCLLCVMFSFYTVTDFYFVKQTAMLIPLFILSLVVKGQSDFVRYGLVAVLLFVSPISYGKTNQAIAVGRSGYEHLKNNEALKNSFAEIPHHITEQKTLILWCYREYDYGNSAQALLPFSTLGNHPIMYTTNITDPNADPETKFARHNKLKVDYILSRHAISWPNLKQVHETEFYHLYKLLD